MSENKKGSNSNPKSGNHKSKTWSNKSSESQKSSNNSAEGKARNYEKVRGHGGVPPKKNKD